MPTNPGPPSQSAHSATVWNWTAVVVICGATILGGIALIEWVWPLFWAAVGLAIGGAVFAWRTGIMAATSEWHPPDPPSSQPSARTRARSSNEQPMLSCKEERDPGAGGALGVRTHQPNPQAQASHHPGMLAALVAGLGTAAGVTWRKAHHR